MPERARARTQLSKLKFGAAFHLQRRVQAKIAIIVAEVCVDFGSTRTVESARGPFTKPQVLSTDSSVKHKCSVPNSVHTLPPPDERVTSFQILLHPSCLLSLRLVLFSFRFVSLPLVCPQSRSRRVCYLARHTALHFIALPFDSSIYPPYCPSCSRLCSFPFRIRLPATRCDPNPAGGCAKRRKSVAGAIAIEKRALREELLCKVETYP